MQTEAQALNRGFIARMARGRPFVTLKLAASADGRTAMASGESQWISSEAARADVHRLRAEAGAVLTSSATVLADDPQLTARGDYPRQPDRIVLDRQARVPAQAKVWADGARRFWFTDRDGPAAPGVERIAVNGFDAAFAALAAKGVNEVLVECGPILAGALLQARQVDELLLYLAPSLLGHEARPLALLPGLARLADRIPLHWRSAVPVGPDLRLTASLSQP